MSIKKRSILFIVLCGWQGCSMPVKKPANPHFHKVTYSEHHLVLRDVRVQPIADGLLTSLGNLTWPIIRDHVDAIFTVDDDSIASAMRLIWERAKIVVEPSGAVPLAAVLSERFQSEFNGNRIGIIISGGNVNLDRLPWQ